RRIRHRVAERVDELVVRNVENLRWSLVQSVKDSFTRIRTDLDKDLDGEITAIRGAIDVVLEKKKESESSIGDEMLRLQSAKELLMEALRRFEETP
ncbi:MAG TPA: hypothetical protein VL354_16775, partial [Spirochaetia bacterium]|nr:hypothetical protein [Spirochaetia bacterium]